MHSTMLSFSLNEAARRGAWTCGSCSTIPRTYQAWFNNSARSLPVRSRRHSSSKPSSSPKDESRAISTPSTAPAKEALAKERSDRRVNRRKSKDVGHESRGKSKDKSLSNMPSVPSTQNLKSQDIHIASFFSIHRPISVTSSFPPPSSTNAFSKIFTPSIYRKPQPADVIYTISSAVETFENATASVHHLTQQGSSGADSENEMRGLITSPPVDGDSSQPHTLHINIEELARHFRPFVPPPPPPPPSATEPSLAGKTSRKTKQKTYSTLVTVVERTHPDGQITYQRIASPLREDSPSEQVFIDEGPSHHMRSRYPPLYQPFLIRMYNRRLAWEKSRRMNLPGERSSREIWRAISVRRQRKLKMKKHKYKKLMKRTKFLRRKLDRL